MDKEDFHRIKGSTMPQFQIQPSGAKNDPGFFPCIFQSCDKSILSYETYVSKCEAELFCGAADRLICELHKAQTLCELRQVFDMMNSLLTSSAAKELSFAEIIKASHDISKRSSHECSC